MKLAPGSIWKVAAKSSDKVFGTASVVSVDFLHACFWFGRDLFSPINFQVEDEMSPVRDRYGEAFWHAHHEAWIESELSQREYCEACGLLLKAFGNWHAMFKAKPQPPARKMLYRRGDLSHGLSHGLSHDLPGVRPYRPIRTRGSSSEVQRNGQTADTSKGDAAGCTRR
jgi:hypothetical protein